jgi:hypothetical protein
VLTVVGGAIAARPVAQYQIGGTAAIDLRGSCRRSPAPRRICSRTATVGGAEAQPEVTVLGEVQSVTSHLYQPELSRADYVNLSGGTTQKADTGASMSSRRMAVVASSGNLVLAKAVMHRRDTIVVPVDRAPAAAADVERGYDDHL